MKQLLILLTLAILIPEVSVRAANVDDVESVLDRLERRLLSRERATSSFLLNDDDNPINAKEVNPDVTGNEIEIRGDVPENDELRALSRTLNDIEAEVDRLVGDIQRTSQKVIEHSKVNNFIELQAVVKDPKQLIIRQLNVYIDDFEVYRIDLSRSVHIPQPSFPLFAGPLEPGAHKMKVAIKFTEIVDDGLPVKQGAFAAVDAEFDLQIPPGTFKKKWDVQMIKEKSGENYRLQLL